jgi:hypothetical protein
MVDLPKWLRAAVTPTPAETKDNKQFADQVDKQSRDFPGMPTALAVKSAYSILSAQEKDPKKRDALNVAAVNYMLDRYNKAPADDKTFMEQTMRELSRSSLNALKTCMERLPEGQARANLPREVLGDVSSINVPSAREVRAHLLNTVKLDKPVELLNAVAKDHHPVIVGGVHGGRDLSQPINEILQRYFPSGMSTDEKQATLKGLHPDRVKDMEGIIDQHNTKAHSLGEGIARAISRRMSTQSISPPSTPVARSSSMKGYGRGS